MTPACSAVLTLALSAVALFTLLTLASLALGLSPFWAMVSGWAGCVVVILAVFGLVVLYDWALRPSRSR